MEHRGHQIVDFKEQFDLLYINGCTITHRVDATLRNIISSCKRRNEQGKIVLGGCVAESLRKDHRIDLFVDNYRKFDLDYILQKIEKVELERRFDQSKFYAGAIVDQKRYIRSFVKVQDGCSNFCSYCIVPYLRGRERFMEEEYFKKLVDRISAAGFKEIVLTGINLGTHPHLLSLIKIADRAKGIARVRLSSINPDHLNKDFIAEVARLDKFMPYMHISIQSGDDHILQLMGRKYDRKYLYHLFDLLNRYFSNINVGTDIIVGFPGEEDSSFLNSCQMVEDLPIYHLHLFPYSVRQGTAASKMEKQIDSKEKRRRYDYLLKIAQRKRDLFLRKNLGKQRVLIEQKKGDYFWGHSENFLPVGIAKRWQGQLLGEIVDLHCDKISRQGQLLASKLVDY